MSILDEPGEVRDWVGGERLAWAYACFLWKGSWGWHGVQGEGQEVKTLKELNFQSRNREAWLGEDSGGIGCWLSASSSVLTHKSQGGASMPHAHSRS